MCRSPPLGARARRRMVYVVVVVVAVVLSLVPSSIADRFVINSSTNLVNLREHPPYVLLVSAFVEPSPWQLWIVVPLVWAYGTIQRWLGRAAVFVTWFFGHVGTTLLMSTILTAGIAHGRISLSEAAPPMSGSVMALPPLWACSRHTCPGAGPGGTPAFSAWRSW